MGPRLCSRGETTVRATPTGRSPSQWGHGFVAVERAAAEQAATLLQASQWGHGFVAVERAYQPWSPVPRGAVAMGPRLCSRGEGRSHGYACPAGQTSQWGHGFVAVERACSPPWTTTAATSQWGHGFVAVERPSTACGCGHTSPVAMGPRLCSRGEMYQGYTTPEEAIVAMGPRLCSRGEENLRLPSPKSRWRRNGATAL